MNIEILLAQILDGATETFGLRKSENFWIGMLVVCGFLLFRRKISRQRRIQGGLDAWKQQNKGRSNEGK